MFKKPKKTNNKTLNILDTSKRKSQFDYQEVFRHIRTNIEFSTTDKDIKSVAITSTQSGEAKSTTSMNLAFSFATKYNRVLLIDTDLRRSTIHKYLKLSNQQGLTNAIMDYRKNKKFNPEFFQIIKNSSLEGPLYVLTSGVSVPNPTELLGSQAFKDYMEVLKEYFDFIIVDCAPVGTVSDAVPIGNSVDGVLFVVSAKDTNRKDAAACIKLLQRSQVNVLGSVLTKSSVGKNHYGYHYYYYY